METTDSAGDESAETIVGTYRRATEWLLLTGDRTIVGFGIAGALGAFFAVLVRLGGVPLLNTQALFYAYSGLIAGNLTLVTVVVSVNQLLLSRELQTPGELQEQIENVVEYRTDVEEATGEVAPVKPLVFLRLLVEATREEAQRLGGFAKNGVVASGREELDDVVTTVTEQMDQIDTLLTDSEADTFSVLSVMLETNYAQQIHRLRTIRADHGEDFADAVHETIDGFIDRLRDIDVARQYFKSIYLQQELTSLSRLLFYAGLPAEAAAIASLLVLTVPPSSPEIAIDLRILLPLTLAIGLLPLAILCSFFLRTATVTNLTAATLPFTTPEQER